MKIEGKVEQLKKKLYDVTNKNYTDQELYDFCISVTYSGVFKRGWNIIVREAEE